MTFRNVLSFRGIENARATKRYHFGIVHGAGRSLAMNVFYPHGGAEKAYLKREFSSITNRFYSYSGTRQGDAAVLRGERHLSASDVLGLLLSDRFGNLA